MSPLELGIYRIMEKQLDEKGHPMQMLTKQFRTSFMKQYEKFVVPSTQGPSADEEIEVRQKNLIEMIIKETVALQCNHVFKMEQQIGKVSEQEIEEELKHKKNITLANHAVDEVKIFVRAQFHFVTLMYKDYFPVGE
jgi:hypothetical protein